MLICTHPSAHTMTFLHTFKLIQNHLCTDITNTNTNTNTNTDTNTNTNTNTIANTLNSDINL